MSNHEALIIVLFGIVLLIAGNVALLKLLAVWINKPKPRVDELDLTEEFKVYYNLANSGFPLWALTANNILCFGIIFFLLGYKLQYVTGMLISGLVILISGLVILWIIYKVRTAKENKDRVLIVVGPKGIQLPHYSFFTWEMISRVSIITIHLSRGGDISTLTSFLKDSEGNNEEKKIEVNLEGSRYSLKYIESVINRYRAKPLRDAFMKG